MTDLIKIYFSVAAIEFLLAVFMFAVTVLVVMIVHFIRVFCEWCFDFFFNRRNRNEP